MYLSRGVWRKPHDFITRNMKIMDNQFKREFESRIELLLLAERILMMVRLDENAAAVDLAVKVLEERRLEYENELKKPEQEHVV